MNIQYVPFWNILLLEIPIWNIKNIEKTSKVTICDLGEMRTRLNMEIKNYKELMAYVKGYELVKAVYEMTRRYPKEEIYGITSQMRRSAISIPSNIAEGYMRGSKEYAQFLKVALGSCAELETQLSLSKDLGFCKESEFNTAYGLNEEVIKLLKTYINRMGAKPVVGTTRYPLTAKQTVSQ